MDGVDDAAGVFLGLRGWEREDALDYFFRVLERLGATVDASGRGFFL